MSAQIRISVERGGIIISTNVNQSIENVRKGDVIYCESVDVHTTYSWTLVFTPDSPNGTVSSSGLIAPPGSTTNNCKFIVDNEGAYLVRLVVDAGLGTESTQFLRVRKITRFGDLKLVAAGERKDSVGAIPFDIDPVGWADDQNQNLQKLLAYVRRLSTSGRVLYVDANRGRKSYDSTQNANDFTNTLEMPGADLSALATSGVVTDAEGFADFSDLSSAITYATDCATRGETALSSDNPYVILVQNGLYIEDVNLVPNIHIVSADNFFTTDNTYAKGVVIRSTNVTGGHTFVGTSNTDRVVCVGVEFENTDGASTNPTFKVQKGIAHFVNCTISQKSGTGGSALSIIPVDHTTTDECQAHLMNSYVQNTVASATDYAIKCGSDNARLVIENSTIVGQNGIQCNADYGGGLKEDVHLHIVRSTVMANNVNGYAILSNASDLQVSYSYVSSSDTAKVLVIGENLPKTGDVVAKLIFSEFSNAQISFDTRQIAGSKTLQTSSCIYSEYVFPDAPPTHNAETQAKSLKYENNYADPFNSGTLAVPVPNQLGATDVQDALDDLTFLSAILGAFGTFNSLDVAYDGVISVNPPTLGSGSGRKIAADQGAVVIQSATAPYITTPISGTETTALTSADKNGYLQVEGNLEVGKVDSAEIELIANYGTIGSMLSLGSVTWSSEISSVAAGVDHRSLPSGIIQGNSDKDGLLHNYNLRLQTKSSNSVSNGSVGWVVLQGGDSLEKGSPGPHAGDVYIQGGSYLESANASIGDNCPAGSVLLIPGTSTGVGSDEPYGYVRVVNPTTSTSARLVASAPCSNPTTVAGEISWATPMGVVTATITIGMTVADVVNAINNATVGGGLLVAQNSAGVINLDCASKGELSDVVYVGDSDSGNVNADLGDFQISGGAVFTAGTDPQYVNIHSSAMHEITIGEGGTVGSMIYNSDTGKLTVPGLIDPTGMIFSEENQNNVPTGANEGAIFVSDGTDGLVANKIYYKPASNGTPVDLTAGGGGGGLTNWTEDGSGHLFPDSANAQNLGSLTNRVDSLYVNTTDGVVFTDGTLQFTLSVPLPSTPTIEFNGSELAYQSAVSINTTAIAGKPDLTSFSVTVAGTPSGNGNLTYDNTTGVFDFTPADVSGGGGLSGTGANGTIGVFDGSGAINGGSALTFNSAAHSLFIDSSAGAFGSFTHYSNSGDGDYNWIVGRSHDGSLLLRTQSSYDATFNESDYDLGWSIDTSGNLLPTGTNALNIGNGSHRVDSIYVNATSSVHYIHDDGVTVHDWALNVDVTDVNNPVLKFNGTDITGGGGGGATDKIEEGDTKVEVVDGGSNGVIIFQTDGTEKWRVRTAGHFVPQTTGVLNIGQATHRVDEIYSQSSMFHFQDLSLSSVYTELSCGGTGALLGRLAQVRDGGAIEVIATHNDTLTEFGSTNFFDTHFIPTANAQYDIGTATNKVRHLFLSDNSLKFVNTSDVEFAMGLNGNNDLTFNAGKVAKSNVASDIADLTTFKSNETITGSAPVLHSSLAEVRKDIVVLNSGVPHLTITADGNTTPTLRITVSDNGQGSTHWGVLVYQYEDDGVTVGTNPVYMKSLLTISTPTHDFEIPWTDGPLTATLPAVFGSKKLQFLIYGSDGANNPTGGITGSTPNEKVTFDYEWNSRRPQVLDIEGEQAYYGDVISNKIIVETNEDFGFLNPPSICFKKNSDYSLSRLSLLSEATNNIEHFGFFSDDPTGYSDGSSHSAFFDSAFAGEYNRLFSIVSRGDNNESLQSASRQGDITFGETSKWVEFGEGVFHFDNFNLLSYTDSAKPLSIQANTGSPTHHILSMDFNGRVGINLPNDESNVSDKVRGLFLARDATACLEINSVNGTHSQSNLSLLREYATFGNTTDVRLDLNLKAPSNSSVFAGRIEARPTELRGSSSIGTTSFSYSELAFVINDNGVVSHKMFLDSQRLNIEGGIKIGDYGVGQPQTTNDFDHGLIVFDSSNKLKLWRARQWQEIMPEVQSAFVKGTETGYPAGATLHNALPQMFDYYVAFDTEFDGVANLCRLDWENGNGQTVHIVQVKVFFYIKNLNSNGVAINPSADIDDVVITLNGPSSQINLGTFVSTAWTTNSVIAETVNVASNVTSANINHDGKLRVSVNFRKPNTNKVPIIVLGARVTYTYDLA